MSEASFACMINCMDGRTQEPVIQFMKQKLGVSYVDAVTEPGPIRYLAEGDSPWVENIRACCDISVVKHRACAIGIVGHYDCAGNPVEQGIQMKQIDDAVRRVRSWYPALPVYGLWVDASWRVEEVIADIPQ